MCFSCLAYWFIEVLASVIMIIFDHTYRGGMVKPPSSCCFITSSKPFLLQFNLFRVEICELRPEVVTEDKYKCIFHRKMEVLASEPKFKGGTEVSIFSFCNLVTLHHQFCSFVGCSFYLCMMLGLISEVK